MKDGATLISVRLYRFKYFPNELKLYAITEYISLKRGLFSGRY